MAKTHQQAQAASGGEEPLSNDKREAFAQRVARGEEAQAAYRAVYGGTERSVSLGAERLMRDTAVIARVAGVRMENGKGKMEDGGERVSKAMGDPAADGDVAEGKKTEGRNEVESRVGVQPEVRPGVFCAEIGRRICARIVGTRRSLRTICGEPGMPELPTLFEWLETQAEFRAQYARARALQAEVIADEILEIADDVAEDTYADAHGKPRVDNEAIQRSKLRVDTRKWLVAKLLPKKYGDRVEGMGANVGAKAEENGGVRLTEERRAALIERRRRAILANMNQR